MEQRASEATPWAVLLMGPTASGKTALSIDLAEALNGEIISVDSALVYRGMDIGTAKPTQTERRGIPHHLIDILDPLDAFSAGQFCRHALHLIQEIHGRGKVPILSGGTMLYFHSLLQGIAELPDADASIRNQLDQEAEQRGWAALHQELAEVDPEAASRIHPNDPQRIQRALEVYRSTGRTQSDWLSDQQKITLPFHPVRLVLMPAHRSELHQTIADRFDQMLASGLVEEARGLYQRGDLSPQLPAIRAVGYRQVWRFLEGEWDYDTMRDKAIIATRQLAKRQYTWLRRQTDADCLESGQSMLLQQALQCVQRSLKG